MSNLRNRRLAIPLVSPFIEFNHTIRDLIFWVMDMVPVKYERSLLRREINWILRLDTLASFGQIEEIDSLPLMPC